MAEPLAMRKTDTLVARVRAQLRGGWDHGPLADEAEAALGELERRLGVLREALEWYAELAHYRSPSGGGRRAPSLIANDRGGRAAAALRQEVLQ